MRGRLLFVAGIVAGYIVGARAGRPAYDAIVARVSGTARNPKVQEAGAKAKAAFEERAPAVAERVEQVAATASAAASAAKDAGDAASEPTTSDGSASTGSSGTPSTDAAD